MGKTSKPNWRYNRHLTLVSKSHTYLAAGMAFFLYSVIFA